MDIATDVAMDIAVWIVVAALAGTTLLASVVDSLRLLAARLRLASGRRLLARQRQRIQALERRGRELQTAIDRARDTFQGIQQARRDTVSALKTLDAVQVELVHEIGVPDGRCPPRRYGVCAPAGLGAISSRNIVFHRDIWRFTNTAVVWSPTADQAYELVASAFGPRSGLQVTAGTAPHPATAEAARWAA